MKLHFDLLFGIETILPIEKDFIHAAYREIGKGNHWTEIRVNCPNIILKMREMRNELDLYKSAPNITEIVDDHVRCGVVTSIVISICIAGRWFQ